MKYFKSIAWWALVVLLYGTVIAGSYFLKIDTAWTEAQTVSRDSDSIRVTSNAIQLTDGATSTTLYSSIDYTVVVGNADTCCGDTNGVTNGFTRLGKVDTVKVILIGERDQQWFQIRRDSGTIPYTLHNTITGDSVLKGYDNLYYQLYLFDTAGSGDTIGWTPKVNLRLIK